MNQQREWDKVELENGIIKITAAQHQSAETVAKMAEDIKKISGNNKYDVLADASTIDFGDGTGVSMAVKLFKTLPVKRVAIYGPIPKFANLRIQKLAKMISDPERLKFFRNEEDARIWLKEK